MSRRVETLLAAARELEVGQPPALAAIRTEAKARARRSAYVVAFALALPLGAAAAAGGWAVRERVRSAVKTEHGEKAPAHAVPAPPGTGAHARDDGDVHALAQAQARAHVTVTPSGGTVAASGGPSSGEGSASPLPGLAPQPRPAGGAAAQSPPRQAAQPLSSGAGVGASARPPAQAPTTADAVSLRDAATLTAKGGAAQTLPTRDASPRSATAQVPTTAEGYSLDAPAGAGSKPRSDSAPAAPVTVAATGGPASTPLSQESALLASALSALRAQHDPAAALALVSQYRARFPDGALKAEVTLCAAEAHRAAGRAGDALTELDTLDAHVRGAELTVLRAELRAGLGRCAEARAELAPVLERLPAALRVRALFTDASCAATLGQRDAARASLEALLTLDSSNAAAGSLLGQLK